MILMTYTTISLSGINLLLGLASSIVSSTISLSSTKRKDLVRFLDGYIPNELRNCQTNNKGTNCSGIDMFRICFNLKINYSSILKLTLLVKDTFCGEVSKSAVLASAPDIKQMKKFSIYKQEIEKRSSSILT